MTSHPSQITEFERFLDEVPPRDRERIFTAFVGYCIGSIDPDVFREALEHLRKELRQRRFAEGMEG